MGTRDFIPQGQAERDEWSNNFAAMVEANFASYGLTAAEKTEVVTSNTQRHSFYVDKQAAEATYRGKIEAWEERDTIFVEIARKYTRKIQARPETIDFQREQLRITVRDTEPSPIGAPATAPIIYIDFSNRLQFIIHWGPNPMNELLNGKPDGVMGCELWIKLDTPPTGPEDMQFVAIDTGSPYVANMQGKAGKTVYWLARYLSTKGEPGPWGEVVSAEVTG
ncbi:MAG: hypothetical protein HY769_10450 [Candidatus Stahlbacteria bacterium]|nr:hypothetical protein [Candidatus Stahlbacteria bacterium]